MRRTFMFATIFALAVAFGSACETKTEVPKNNTPVTTPTVAAPVASPSTSPTKPTVSPTKPTASPEVKKADDKNGNLKVPKPPVTETPKAK